MTHKPYKITNQDKVRSTLRKCLTGLSAVDLSTRLNVDLNLIRVMLNRMPDTYIASWAPTRAGAGFMAVWKCVEVPDDAPRPKNLKFNRKEYDIKYRERMRQKRKLMKQQEQTTRSTQGMTQIRGPWPTEVHDARVH